MYIRELAKMLKPCPFCGRKAEYAFNFTQSIQGTQRLEVYCVCGATFDLEVNPKRYEYINACGAKTTLPPIYVQDVNGKELRNAIELWNNRPGDRIKGDNITFGEVFAKFKEKYPAYAKLIEDYRPSKYMNGITVWLKGNFYLSVTYDENTDKFELLDLTNYTFYKETNEND